MPKEVIESAYKNRQIESEERTAMSVLIGLNQRFARDPKDELYSADELHTLISNLMTKIRRGKLTVRDIEYTFNPPKQENKDPIWKAINKEIERSKIKRYPWKEIFGESLTSRIHHLRKQGKTVDETKDIIMQDKKVQEFIKANPYEKEEVFKNIEISVSARYGENNTAKKIEEEE